MSDGPIENMERSGPSPWKGVFICALIGSVGWLLLDAGSEDYSPPLATKLEEGPPEGVIGREDRVALHTFRPSNPDLFPGWEEAIAGVVRISCNGAATGGGVLIGEGDVMLTAAHVFLNERGVMRDYRVDTCVAIHPGGDRVEIDVRSMKAGPFEVPEGLGNHFSVGITQNDWAVLRLSRVPRGARPLPLASAEQLTLEEHHPILNISGATDNFDTDGFLAQVCAYRGPPPTASALNEEGEIVGRPFEEEDRLLVARYDCDIGAGGSGSPAIGWYEGVPMIWGVMTDSLRGRDRCPDVGRNFCYTAGPLAPAMDVVP